MRGSFVARRGLAGQEGALERRRGRESVQSWIHMMGSSVGADGRRFQQNSCPGRFPERRAGQDRRHLKPEAFDDILLLIHYNVN